VRAGANRHAISLAALLSSSGCGAHAPGAGGPLDAGRALSTRSTGSGRPPLAVIAREGDAKGAMAVAVTTAGLAPDRGALAGVALAALVEARLAARGVEVTSVGGWDGWRLNALVDSPADMARVGSGARVLDVATGTGDLAIELARRVSPDGEVVGSDFSEEMLTRARAKWERERRSSPNSTPASVRFEWGDALQLPYEDDSFDAATVGFGARNFSDLARGLREMARVVQIADRMR